MMKLEALTLKALIEQSIPLHAQRTALGLVDGPSLSFEAFGERMHSLALVLKNLGIGYGHRVALLGENMPNWGVAYFAITTLGAVVVPILPDFHSSAVQHIVRHAECRAVIVSQRLVCKLADGDLEHVKHRILLDDFSLMAADRPHEPFKDLLKRAMREMEKLKEAVQERHGRNDRDETPAASDRTDSRQERILDEPAGDQGDLWYAPRKALRRMFAAGRKEFERLKDTALRAAGWAAHEVKEDDLAAIIYTSGTTGNSKGVMLSHRNIVANALGGAEMAEITPDDRMLSILPLSHTYECTLGLVLPLYAGASVMYLGKPPTPSILLPALAKVRPTFLLSVPLVLEKIYRNRVLPQLTANPVLRGVMKVPALRRRLHRLAGKKLLATFGGELRCCCIGGAPLAPEVETFLREAGFPYSVGYGLTETSPLITGVLPRLARFRSCGPVMPGVSVRIDRPNAATGEGEILVRGPNVMQGYFKAPQATRETFTEDGWLKTGDLGLMDGDGYLYIKGRLKNMILGPSGENIYPEEIEAVLGESPFVLESLVYEDGGRIVGRVHLDSERLDASLSLKKLTESEASHRIRALLEELRAEANKRLAAYCRLHRLMEQPEPFEKTPTQKIKRYLYVQG